MRERSKEAVDQELAELFGVVIGLLPDELSQQVRQQLLPMLASGWSPDPERMEAAMKLIQLVSDRRKAVVSFQKLNQQRQSKARAWRPALIALKAIIHSRSPRLSESQLEIKTAGEATRLLKKEFSPSQVRRATSKPR